MSSMQEMFEEGVQDLYNAEKQLIKALPKMAKMAQSPELRQAFEKHLEQTQNQAKRLEQIAEMMDFKPTGMVCKGMQGLVEEANEHMQDKEPSACTDAEVIMLAQKVEHYEIASYGTLCEWAKLMGQNDALNLLKETLNEEEQTDEMLSQMAEREINMKAMEESNNMDMEEGSSKRKSGSSKKSSSSRSSSRKSPAKSASVM